MTKIKFTAYVTLSGGPNDPGKTIDFVQNWKILNTAVGIEIFGLGDVPEVHDRILVTDEDYLTYWRVTEVQKLDEPSNYHWSVKVQRGSFANLKGLRRLKMSDT